jgi:hypothetical protein
MQSIGVVPSRIKKTQIWVASNPPAVPYSAWEQNLYNQMQAIGIWPRHLTEIETWMNSNPLN